MTQPGSWALAMEKNLRQAAEEGEVSDETQSMAPAERVTKVAEALIDEGFAEYYKELAEVAGRHDTDLSNIRHGRRELPPETASLYVGRLCRHFDVEEDDLLHGIAGPPPNRPEDADPVPAPQAADTPREESPSGPESHEGGTDSVSEEQPEAPSGEPEETGSTPGGEGGVAGSSTSNEVEKEATPRPTIHLEADGQRFVAHRNGDGWDLELRVRGVDREIAGDLHDVAFGLLFDRMEETSA